MKSSPFVGIKLLAVASSVSLVAVGSTAGTAARAQTYTLTTLASFTDGATGASPASPVLGSNGLLYGISSNVNGGGYGAVFAVSTKTGALNAVATFNGTNGVAPLTLTIDGAGNLYGTAESTGVNTYGSVFEIAAGTSTITTLTSFNGTNGTTPLSLVSDAAGDLYGTTSGLGGLSMNSKDTLYRIAAGTGTVTTLASFAKGINPVGMTVDSVGDVFGITEAGGTSGIGSVFEVAAGTGTVKTLANFTGANGASPQGDVVLDSAGNLYGTTREGGTGSGTVFKIAAGTSTLTTVANFSYPNGTGPTSLIVDASGNLFGTTEAGDGNGNNGLVFEIAAGTGVAKDLTNLDGLQGEAPAAIVLGANGTLYGTANGGLNQDGTIFALTPAASGTAPEPGSCALLLLAGVLPAIASASDRFRRRSSLDATRGDHF